MTIHFLVAGNPDSVEMEEYRPCPACNKGNIK